MNLHVEQGAKLQEVKGQLAAMTAKADSLSAEILAAKLAMENQGEEGKQATLLAVGKLEDQLVGLKADIDKLTTAQAALILQIKDCCKNNSALGLLVKSGVEQQMAGVSSEATETEVYAPVCVNL